MSHDGLEVIPKQIGAGCVCSYYFTHLHLSIHSWWLNWGIFESLTMNHSETGITDLVYKNLCWMNMAEISALRPLLDQLGGNSPLSLHVGLCYRKLLQLPSYNPVISFSPRVRLSGFKYQFHHLPAMWLWKLLHLSVPHFSQVQNRDDSNTCVLGFLEN